MWKVLPTYTRRLVYNRQIFTRLQFRSFLSESFQLENAWKDRLQSPIINKIKINDMFYELDNQFNHFGYASALDVDLFVNAVNNGTSFDELEDLVHRLRLSPEAVNILPSTQHAIIRLYLKWDKIDDLMRILDDRLNYGVFPDDYCSLLLLNTFIKEGNFRDAAKISNLGMLQEDVSNDLIKYMSLYACHKYLENPVPWVKEIDKEQSVDDEKEEDDEEEEVVKIRVKYSRNPYFDDHFDLVDPKHLIGKTLHFIGSELDDTAGRTYKLIGLLLHDKLEQAKIYIETLSLSEENNVVLKDGLNIATDLLNEKSLLEGKDASYSVLVNELKDLLNNSFSSSQLAVDESLLSIVENRLKDLINKNETIEINKQLQLYKEWEQTRENLLMEQILKINKDKQLAEIQLQKQLMEEKEEELFFFENEDKIDLIIEEKEKRKKEEEERNAAIKQARLKLDPPGKQRLRRISKKDIVQPLESFYDENIPKKNIDTKIL